METSLQTCPGHVWRKTHWPVEMDPPADKALQPSAGTREDSSIHHADRTVLVVRKMKKKQKKQEITET